MSGPSLLLLGCGCVGGCVLQLLPSFINPLPAKLFILDKMLNLPLRVSTLLSESNNPLCKSLNIETINTEITQSNYNSLLTPYIKQVSMVINLTTAVDSISLFTLSNSLGAMYVDASVEIWGRLSLPIVKRHQQVRDTKGIIKTTLLELGMNPGIISWLSKLCERELKAKYPLAIIKAQHITEFDTHILKDEYSKGTRDNTYWNTWSAYGQFEELTEMAEMAVPKTLKTPKHILKQDQMIAIKQVMGYQCYIDSVTPVFSDQGLFQNWLNYQGYVTSHGECETISRRLGQGIYCPFVFKICPDSDYAISKWGKVEAPSYKIMEGTHIQQGSDTIGILSIFETNGSQKGWWFGSSVSVSLANKLCSITQNGTSITVGAAVLAGVKWAFSNGNKGILFPDDISDFEIYELAKPFLGTLMGNEVPSDMLKHVDSHPKMDPRLKGLITG